MCESADHDHGAATAAQWAVPRAIEGDAVDPVTLEPVDEVVITMLVDNSYDGLMADMGPLGGRRWVVRRRSRRRQFGSGETVPGLVAEHGFAALVTTRRGDRRTPCCSTPGCRRRARGQHRTPGSRPARSRRSSSATATSTMPVASPGCPGCAAAGLPITLHPLVWTPRRVALPGAARVGVAHAQRRSSVEAEGFEVIERRQPSVLLDGSVLITGEIDRTTDFETGHAVPRGTRRRRMGARPADPRRSGADRPRARPRSCRADRVRTRRRGEHLPVRDAAHRRRPS